MKTITTFNLHKHDFPFVISIPHSGEYITPKMKSNLQDNVIFSNIDWYLPKFYYFLKEMGFTTIINRVSRYVIDVNRGPKQRDKENNYTKNFVYTKTTFGNEIYKSEISNSEIEDRINQFYIPYHQMINQAIQEKLKYFNKVYLIDLHSFGRDLRADIILGNGNGKTTNKAFLEQIEKMLNKEGFRVKNNELYSGGYITKYYGSKRGRCETLQMELWYGTYIEKRDFENEEFPNINEELFLETQQRIRNFFEALKNYSFIIGEV